MLFAPRGGRPTPIATATTKTAGKKVLKTSRTRCWGFIYPFFVAHRPRLPSDRIRLTPRAMDLQAKIRTIPTEPGVYLYKNAEGDVIYVGKAKNLRSRVSSYFHEGRWEDAKTGTLVREAVDVDYIVVANNKEALALENNLIKQR